uniref:H15 domain-containing protein n=2 Tax=Nymphaea colorata TaxID=210225 RepID=A0A5K1GLB1_9MAGN
MIKEAITALHEKSGSSAYAIAKHMEMKHKAVLPANYKKKLAMQLKNAAATGKLIKVKASFKLAELAKKKAPAAPAKKRAAVVASAAKPKAPPKRASRVEKHPLKKTPKKKPVTTKPKAKSIKSAKSPVARKPRRG